MTPKAIAFTLRGSFGFFKKPDMNNHTCFTYSHIHKVALLGILGAILGLGGHRQKSNGIHPEFYEVLSPLHVSVIPNHSKGYFKKKIQVFNNTVGYANSDQTLNVREQWLERPSWDIYISDPFNGSGHFTDLNHALINRTAAFLPYLGKNDHPATIENVRNVNLNAINKVDQCHSLMVVNEVTIKQRLRTDERNKRNAQPIFFQEQMPCSLSDATGHYEYKPLCFTNLEIENHNQQNTSFYEVEDRIISFH